jgi:shikimate kinase/3-dehydroquinate synthase
MNERTGHVWLVGMPGAGKSETGTALARRLGFPFVDLDREIERRAGRTIGEIFEQEGEAAFRELERSAMCTAADGPRAVLSTGGGAVIAEENRRLMRRTGFVLALEVDEATARARLAGSPTVRPLLVEPDAWARLAAERGPLYASVADAWVHGHAPSGSPEPVAGWIANMLEHEWVFPHTAVPVSVEGREHEVIIGADFLRDRRLRMRIPEARPGGMAFLLADQRVSDLYLEPVARAAEEVGWQAIHLPVPDGEQAKTIAVAEALYRQLALREAQREDLVVALGGGSTGDLAGFVAATYLRGMPVVQIPTTLLAMVDAAIGGKTAVNLPAGKNLVGAFHQPVAVLADVGTLATLPEGEFRSGLGEVAKYALAFDGGLFELLERETGRLLETDPPSEVLGDIVLRCVRIKAEIVSRDERDAGERLHLNYGHTLGHALERLDRFAGRSHGEAVSIGMVFAARLAERLQVANPGLVDRHVRLLEPLGLPTGAPLPDSGEILDAMRMDKKRRGALRFVLLEDVGRPAVVADVPDDVVAATLEAM